MELTTMNFDLTLGHENENECKTDSNSDGNLSSD